MKARGPQLPVLRVAIVGAGLMGYWHGRAAQRLGAEIVVVVDPNADCARTLARALGVRSTAADATVFFQSGHVDAVHICSPLSTHAALARRSIECGIHTLVEKPLAKSAEETRALFDLARGEGVILCPVHQVAFQDGVAHALQAIDYLRAPSAIEIRICSAGGVGRTERDLDEIAGEILPHPLSVLRKLWPNADWKPELWCVSHSRPGEMLVSGDYAGALLSMLISMHARPTCFETIVCGGRGTLQLDFFHGFSVRYDGHISRARKVLRPFSAAIRLLGVASANLLNRAIHGEAAYPGLRSLIRNFYAAARYEAPGPISAEDAIAVAAARDRILAIAFSEPDEKVRLTA
jgi:predicted dehydrogenase